MKKPTDFSRILAAYLTTYLPSLRNVTGNTVSSYCDTFPLLFTFCRDVYGLKAESLGISDFSPGMIQDFLSWLKNERGNSISMRNQRLAAIRAFFRYAEVESPENMLLCQKIIQIPFSKREKPVMNYLSINRRRKVVFPVGASGCMYWSTDMWNIVTS